MGEKVEDTAVPEKKIKDLSTDIETDSTNGITIYEAVKAATVPDKQNEEYVEAEVLSEGASGAVLKVL